MVIGSFCYLKGGKFHTLRPNKLQITGTQSGFVQNLEIYQSIKSDEDLSEVSYVFPTDNNLCIYRMKFQVGDETIEAELQSTKSAKETFEEAKKIGRTVAMTEEISPGLTSVKIGNVPKEKVLAIIFQCTFVSNLTNQNTILSKIPLQASEPDGSFMNLYELENLDINLELSIKQMLPISDVYSNCESSFEKVDDFSGKLKIKSAVLSDENILILTELKSNVESQMIQTKNAAVISVIPEFESAKTDSKEFVFLIDCSASMLGESLRKAKESLQLFLERLPKDCYFNIIRFGTTFDKLFKESQKIDKSQLKKAQNFVQNMKANLGGTQMLKMLEELFNNNVKIGDQRQIFIITDGEVYERQKVIQKVEENNGFNRIFAIGLGHGADAGFLDEITSLTNGKYDFVFNADELPSKVSEHFDLSLKEAAIKTEIHIEGNDSFETVPYPLPPLLPNVVTHFFVATTQPFADVMITGVLKNGTEVENVVSLKSSINVNEGEKSPVFALFAQRQLKLIEKEIYKNEENEDKKEENENKLIKLSLESGVLSSKTSYIAVSQGTYIQPNLAKPSNLQAEIIEETVTIDRPRFACFAAAPMPMACPPPPPPGAGCSSLFRATDICECECAYAHVRTHACAPPTISYGCPPPPPPMASPSYSPMSPSFKEDLMCECDAAPMDDGCPPPPMAMPMAMEEPARPLMPAPPPPPSTPVGSSDLSFEELKADIDSSQQEDIWKEDVPVTEIMRLQSRDGFWDLPTSFISKKCDQKQIEIGIDLSESPIIKKRVASTVFTIAYLIKFYNESSNKWRFAKEKGLKWLKRIESSANWDEIISNAISLISK